MFIFVLDIFLIYYDFLICQFLFDLDFFEYILFIIYVKEIEYLINRKKIIEIDIYIYYIYDIVWIYNCFFKKDYFLYFINFFQG